MTTGTAAARTLCESLMATDDEAEVVALLKAAGYWDNPKCWRYYGDQELNWSQAGGQQARADFALNEKVINSIDAVLTLKCLSAGISPESDKAPPTIRAAVARFIEGAEQLNTVSGRVEDWTPSFRTKVAENISVFTTEAKGAKSGTKPSVNVADLGEGHTPEAFPYTLVSLGKRNKASVAFVQGKFCQGGSGAVRHCGEHKLQLVISRRNQPIVGSSHVSATYPKDETDHMWGFTIVRREKAASGSKMPVLTYLAPVGVDATPGRGGVLRFEAEEMPLFPQGDVAYKRNVSWGTLMKLYSYQLKSTGNILRRDGLLYKLDLLLPDPALPIRMHECRKRAHGEGEKGASEQTTTMAGLFSRLKDSQNLEDAPPSSIPLTVRGRQLIARIFAFKPEKGATYRANEGIILTVNGQAHADIKAAFFARKKVGLQRLARDLLVVVDCSSLDAIERDDLFMTSRDRVAEESPMFTELEKSLEDALREHPGLRELRNRRAQDDLAEQLADDKPLESVLQQILKNSPTLAKLFGKGERLSSPFKPTKVKEEPEPKLLPHPTYFHFSGKDPDQDLVRLAHLEQKCRVTFATDVVDDYFTRKYDRGLVTFTRLLSSNGSEEVQTFTGPVLHRGRGTLSFELPSEAKAGEQLRYEVIVSDPVTQKVFANKFVLNLAAPQEKNGKPGKPAKPPGQGDGDSPDGAGGIAIPKVIRLDKGNPKWPQHFEDEDGCMDVVADPVEAGGKSELRYMFYLNTDNRALQTELKGSKGDAALLLKQFEVAAVLCALALIHDDLTKKAPSPKDDKDGANDKDSDADVTQRIRIFTRAVAPILLPMISSLGDLGVDALEKSDLVGDAAAA